jgi:hypothetical protein
MMNARTWIAMLGPLVAGATLAQDADPKPTMESPATPTKEAPKAAPSKAAEMGKPPAELDQLKVFVGNWRGDCTSPGKGDAPPDAYKVTVNVGKAELGGYWLPLSVQDKPTKDRNGQTRESWGWDPVAKTYVRIITGNSGQWGVGWSGGWQENKLGWTGEINNFRGSKVEFRHAFTKKSEREISDIFELKLDGLWKPVRECTYKR